MQLEFIKHLSLAEPKTLLERMVKLQEECGELAQEVLIQSKSSGSKHKQMGKDGIKGEAVDVVLVALSLFFSQGGDIEELNVIAGKKCEKWKLHQG